MHWVMWIVRSSVAALIIGSVLVDLLSKKKYNLNKKENSINQNVAEADALREIGRYNNQSGSL